VSRPAREAALRRFTGVWVASAAAKLAGLALFVYLVSKFLGGSL
jgi:hypothetical protein